MTTKSQIKINKIRMHSGLTVKEIAQRMDLTVQQVYKYLDDEKSCKLATAEKLERATNGISHQFFMYPVPTALQFLPKRQE